MASSMTSDAGDVLTLTLFGTTFTARVVEAQVRNDRSFSFDASSFNDGQVTKYPGVQRRRISLELEVINVSEGAATPAEVIDKVVAGVIGQRLIDLE